jgi:hypothetical protein
LDPKEEAVEALEKVKTVIDIIRSKIKRLDQGIEE